MNVMDITIRMIYKTDYHSVHAFQWDYLDRESYEDFFQRVEAHPDLYLVAFYEEEMVGICYGEPTRRDPLYFCLQGIAVSLEEAKGYARKGIGSMLLNAIEEEAKRKGYHTIGLGSADDKKVERFYLKNGYHPVELVAKGSSGEELERVKITNYDLGLITKQEMNQKYHPWEVIFIFEKNIGSYF